MNNQLPLLCSHFWECPSPDGMDTVTAVCRYCGATKEMKTSYDFKGAAPLFLGTSFKRPLNPIDDILEASRKRY